MCRGLLFARHTQLCRARIFSWWLFSVFLFRSVFSHQLLGRHKRHANGGANGGETWPPIANAHAAAAKAKDAANGAANAKQQKSWVAVVREGGTSASSKEADGPRTTAKKAGDNPVLDPSRYPPPSRWIEQSSPVDRAAPPVSTGEDGSSRDDVTAPPRNVVAHVETVVSGRSAAPSSSRMPAVPPSAPPTAGKKPVELPKSDFPSESESKTWSSRW